MSNNEQIENSEEQEEYIEQEETKSGPSGMSLFVDRIKNWLNNQNKTLVFGVGGLVLLVLGFLAYQKFYKIPRENAALAAIFKTQEFFDNDSFRLVAKMAPKLADKWSGTKGGKLASYMAGVSLLYTGEYKKAIKYLEDLSFSDRVMSAQVVGLLGDAYVENKDLEKGLKQYLKAAKSAKNEFSVIWWYRKAARVHEKKNEWKEALKIYELLKKDYPEDEANTDVDKYIARAQAKLDSY